MADTVRYRYYVDADATDQGAVTTQGNRSIKDLITTIGTSLKATLVYSNSQGNTTSYTVSTDLDLTTYTNITHEIENGALLAPATGKTLTIPSPANIQAGLGQVIMTGAGTLAFANPGPVSSLWFAADPWDSFSEAAASLTKGGTILVQDAIYDADKNISIASSYPIHLKGTMARSYVTGGVAYNSAYIRPRAAIAGAALITYNGKGGGTISGLSFLDDSDLAAADDAQRVVEIDAAILVTEAHTIRIDNCFFYDLNGSAVEVVTSTFGKITRCLVQRCGDTGKPAVYLNGVAQSFDIDHTSMEVCFSDDYLAIGSSAKKVKITNCGFEANAYGDPAVDLTNFTFIDDDGEDTSIIGCHFNTNYAVKVNMSGTGSKIIGCAFEGNNFSGALVVSGAGSTVSGIDIRSATSNVGTQVTVSGNYCNVSNLYMQRGGNLVVSGVQCNVSNIQINTPDSTETYYVSFASNKGNLSNFTIQGVAGTTGGLAVTQPYAKITNGTIYTIAGIGLAVSGSGDYSQITNIQFNTITGDGIDIETGGNSCIITACSFVSITGQSIDDNATSTRIVDCSGVEETVTTGSPTLQTFSVSYLNSAGGAITATLPNGSFAGQIKTIKMSDATTSSTVSVSAHETSDPEVFTFAQVTDILILMWNGLEWVTINNQGAAV